MNQQPLDGVAPNEGSLRVSATARFLKDDVILRKYGRYHTVTIPGGVALAAPGEPALPWVRCRIGVPWDVRIEGLTASEVETAPAFEDVVVEPCQLVRPVVPGAKIARISHDERIYASENVWPKTVVRHAVVHRKLGLAFAEVEICPFRYQPGTRRLQLVEKLVVTLDYQRTGRAPSPARSIGALAAQRKLESRLSRTILNPQDIARFRHLPENGWLRDYVPLPPVQSVIVTSSALADAFEALATWRTRLGLFTRVVRLEDIRANAVPDTGGTQFFLPNGATRDDAEAIRNFIKWATVEWATEYVLLGGDTDVVPMRQAISSCTCHTGIDVGVLDDGVNIVRYRDINAPDINKAYDTVADPAKQLAHSATASSAQAGYAAGNVLDDDATTSWKCAADDNQRWLELSLDPHTPVNCVKLTWGNGFAASYHVLLSVDGANWSEKYQTSTGAGGTEQITFATGSAQALRIRVDDAPGFALVSVGVYGPARSSYNGAAYAIDATTTRCYLAQNLQDQLKPPDPAKSVDDNLKDGNSYLLIMEGAQAGTVIPHDAACTAAKLGWRFVDDLVATPSQVSPTATRFLEICGPSPYHQQPFVIAIDGYWADYAPTDLYYADVAADQYQASDHHDWDADGNGIYGERYGQEVDGVDGSADIFVGRVPAKSVQDVVGFVDKVKRFERFQDVDGFDLPADFALSVLLGASNLEAAAPELDRSAVVSEQIKEDFLAHSSDWQITRRYQDYLAVPDQGGGNLAEATTASILDAIRSGKNCISLISHGDYSGLCFIGAGDLAAMANNPGVLYGDACSTAKLDSAYGSSVAESAVLNPQGGAVAYVGSSRMSSTGDGCLDQAFWATMFTAERVGEMLNGSRSAMWDPFQAYLYNLVGDPAMRVWSDRPIQLDVAHASSICLGSQSFSVAVSTGGKPVANALVCLTMDGSLFVTAVTNAAGKVAPMITPSVTGLLRVTASGRNMIPYFGSANVEQCDQPPGCGPAIICGSNLMFGPDGKIPFCPNALALECYALYDFNTGCPAIDPEDFDIDKILEPYEKIRELWGIEDPRVFASMAEQPAVKAQIELLPAEVRKPIQLMLKRIRKDGSSK